MWLISRIYSIVAVQNGLILHVLCTGYHIEDAQQHIRIHGRQEGAWGAGADLAEECDDFHQSVLLQDEYHHPLLAPQSRRAHPAPKETKAFSSCLQDMEEDIVLWIRRGYYAGQSG